MVDLQLVDRDALLDAVGVEDRDLLGAELEQRVQRRAGAALGARLEPAPGEQERHDDADRLEVDVAGGAAALGQEARAVAHVRDRRRRGTAARRPTSVQAAIVPIEMSVSIVAVPWRRFIQAAR